MSNTTIQYCAQFFSSVTVVFGGLAALFAILALRFSRLDGDIKNAELERYKQESSVKVSEADAGAAKANMIAAKAHVRANELELKYHSAKIELQRLVLSQERRNLWGHNFAQFKAALKNTPRNEKITVLYPLVSPSSGDYEPGLFASDVLGALSSLKFDVEYIPDVGNFNFGPGIPGFRIFPPREPSDKSSSIINDLHRAFTAAGYEPRVLSNSMGSENITVVVGEKPKHLEPQLNP